MSLSKIDSKIESKKLSDVKMLQPKTVVIGDAGVGKTSLIRYLYQGRFDPSVEPTIAAAFCTYRHPETQIQFNIWDTAGQERFLAFVPMYLRNARVVLMVYDISKPATLNKIITYWYNFATQHCDPETIYVLVENKIDLASTTATSEETTQRAKKFITSVSDTIIHFAQVSPRLGVGIYPLFDYLARQLKNGKITWPSTSGLVQLQREMPDETWTEKMLTWFKCQQ
jgi:Ras-related protein Rab-5C